MYEKQKSVNGQCIATAVAVCAAIAAAINLSACGAVFGVRHFEAWNGGPAFDFAEGTDFHVGANAIDQVDDRRGVRPTYQKTGTKQEKY